MIPPGPPRPVLPLPPPAQCLPESPAPAHTPENKYKYPQWPDTVLSESLLQASTVSEASPANRPHTPAPPPS